jgi:hypothetical protein
MKKLCILVVFIVAIIQANAQTTNWDFISNTEGWTLANSVTGQANASVLTINITGSDPYIVSANDLNFSAALHNKLKIVVQNQTSAVSYDLMFRTDINPNWTQSVTIMVKPFDTIIREYYVDLSSNPNWQGNIIQLRLDPGDNNTGQKLLIDQIAFMQQVSEWNLTTTNEGWIPANSITGDITNGIYTLNITGSDPYIMSPTDLNLDAMEFNQLNISMQNMTSDGNFRVYFITSDDLVWNDTKSVAFTTNTNQTEFTTCEVFMIKNSEWKGNIKQIRIDPGDGNSLGQIKIDWLQFSLQYFGLDNGILHIKQDLTRGGAISYISKSGIDRSLVNIADEGRYIQQSYYAGNSINRIADGQQPTWSPWSWNPIQVGDAFRNRAKILDYQNTGNTLYVKCTPMLWDMNGMNAEAEMEQWSTLIGNTIHVKCRLTCHRTDNLYGENVANGQEYPAVYPISALNYLYTYTGNAPFTSAPIENPAVVNLSSGFWGVYPIVSEHWMAFLDNNNWGMGIYNDKCDQWLAGMAGNPGDEALGGSTSYIAPSGTAIINKNTILEYEYDIIIGSLQEIRSFVYNQHFNVLPPTITPYTQINDGTWTQTNTATICEGGSVSFGPHPLDGTWSWMGPNGFSASTRQVIFTEATYAQSGIYTATYTDGNGNSNTQNFTLSINAAPFASITVSDETCEQENGSLKLSFTDNPSRGNIRFSIDGGLTYPAYVNDNTATYEFAGLAPGDYNVWSSWGNQDCPLNLGTHTVQGDLLPTATITTSPSALTIANGSITFTFTDTPTRSNIAFSIDNGATYTSVAENLGTYTISNLAAGTYQLWTRWGNAECPVYLGEYNILATQTLTLQQGWNLISVTVSDTTNSNGSTDAINHVSTVFQNMDVEIVKNADGFWKPNQPEPFNSLQTLEPGNGYLVYMNSAGMLSINGSVQTPLMASLSPGWNLIGYPGCSDAMPCVSIPFSNYFNSTNCQTIKNFDGFWVPNGTLNSIENFEVGKGYYIKSIVQ